MNFLCAAIFIVSKTDNVYAKKKNSNSELHVML